MPKKAKKVSSSAMRDFAVPALLIVFGVLIALFLNSIREQQRVTADLKTAYQNLRAEVESNRDTLTAVTEYHRRCVELIDSLLQENSGEIPPSKFSTILSHALPKGLRLPEMQDAAWTTLHSTGLVASLKFNDVYPLTKLYYSQKVTVDVSRALSNFSSQIEMPEKQRTVASLKALQSFLINSYNQEKRLLADMNTALDAGQNWRYLE